MHMHYTQMGRETETHRQAHRTQIEENTNIQDAQYDNSLHIRSYIIETGATILY